MEQVIAFSRQAPHIGRPNLQALIARYGAAPRPATALQSNKYVLVALMLPSLAKSFDAYATASAYRDALFVGIAAERHRLKTGRFPAQLTELVPEYLRAAPLDPFGGQPLHLITQGDDILIYSVGRDGKDDGGQNAVGNSSDPDIAVRIELTKHTAP
jgi:hypothetical protein